MRYAIVALLAAAILVPALAMGRDTIQRAAYNGDLAQVEAHIRSGADPDARDAFGGTALHAAMFQKNMAVVRLLIESGWDVNARGRSNGYTPLHDAVWAENLEAARLLLKSGARLDIAGKDGLTPLEKARKEGKGAIATVLETHDR